MILFDDCCCFWIVFNSFFNSDSSLEREEIKFERDSIVGGCEGDGDDVLLKFVLVVVILLLIFVLLLFVVVVVVVNVVVWQKQ